MQGLRLVTSPAAKSSGTATSGRCCSASESPDSPTSRVATHGIIASFARMSRTALVAGGSGLVGGHLLRSLLTDAAYTRVVTLGRRQIETRHAKLEQRIVDFGALDTVSDLPRTDDAFCCLGTTIKTAGSQEAFRKVDYDYVLAFARIGQRA